MIDEGKLNDEDQMIENEFQALLNDYLNSNHRRKVDVITRAFNMAKEAHKGARRRSGEPYIMHPLSVARIVSKEIGLGSTSISASLLHDVVEDTEYTVEDIRALFGDKIASIVDGLTKISSGMFGENVSTQAENFRKLLLTMSDDIRVILIKIADRLHNMRTLSSMSSTKQYKITGETLYIYAPLAHRLGLFAIKTELEELCFKYEHPEIFANLTRKIEETAPERNKIYENFAVPVVESLDKMNIEYEMRARVKSVYSIWNKMEKKGIEFNEVYDLFAVRIIFEMTPGIDEKKQCWDIYSAITDIYKLRPDRIRDWVSHPKANGYQALHLTVMGPDGKWIEIQIRSRRMDDIAEKGFAAHWKYKENRIEEDNELDKWLKTIQEILANPNPNAIDFLDTVKMNLFSSEIFVFTPKGEIKTLPQGATALDFAYSIHTRIGDHCLGAKVNHTLVPLSQKLRSGDQIEILTSQSVNPQPEWINFVTTAKARTKIEASLRRQRRRIADKGKNMLDELFDQEPIDNTTFNKILHKYKAENKDDLYYMIGNSEVVLPTDKKAFIKIKEEPEKKDNLFVRYVKQAMSAIKKPATDQKTKKGEDEELILDDNELITPIPVLQTNTKIDRNAVYDLKENNFKKNFIVPSCCNPLPGDDVFGVVTDKEEVEVHKRSCQTGLKLKSNFGDRLVDVTWGDYRQYSFLASIVFTGIDRIGILSTILAKLAEDVVLNIQSVNVSSNDGIFEGVFNVHVHSAEEVNQLCAKIAKVNGVTTVHRSNL
ncbi:MAG: RelA/SpoT family protein [Fermentimonas sp.]|jgi:GTP pyrophosphokinase|nr:RelA/SpoT family protein [Fermentimonas sp.]NLC85326.1 bifunctional (p)ppGpp synthetase/guanosine-3',5'-bis(diphosphate) 3'-pyrophosphohydrolase [Bacteroidales bacterium]HBT85061.1 GTP pyrophosphokinase [Porphyromonadaceae bacterium]MDD2930724.1 RelA/SpoT family protein [Fermentimonas sp.]MDD3189228.1 RelA/SpoT family protein [Fermentimonas sp.]